MYICTCCILHVLCLCDVSISLFLAGVLMASDHAPVGCGFYLYALSCEAPRIFFGPSKAAPRSRSKRGKL